MEVDSIATVVVFCIAAAGIIAGVLAAGLREVSPLPERPTIEELESRHLLRDAHRLDLAAWDQEFYRQTGRTSEGEQVERWDDGSEYAVSPGRGGVRVVATYSDIDRAMKGLAR